jgi:hypothetical protein
MTATGGEPDEIIAAGALLTGQGFTAAADTLFTPRIPQPFELAPMVIILVAKTIIRYNFFINPLPLIKVYL